MHPKWEKEVPHREIGVLLPGGGSLDVERARAVPGIPESPRKGEEQKVPEFVLSQQGWTTKGALAGRPSMLCVHWGTMTSEKGRGPGPSSTLPPYPQVCSVCALHLKDNPRSLSL